MTKTHSLADEFADAMFDVYRRAVREANYKPRAFLDKLTRDGALVTAHYLLHTGQTAGFTALWQRKRLDLTVEYLILQPKWKSLFSDDDRDIAVQRLRAHGYTGKIKGGTP